MKVQERRQAIVEALEAAQNPISASDLAASFDISRQIIVSDINRLRQAGYQITSTHRGYIMSQTLQTVPLNYRDRICCRHSLSQTQRELEIVLDHGAAFESVEIDHPIYGLITASLAIEGDQDIQSFMSLTQDHQGALLSSLTQGIHYHTLKCPDKASFLAIKAALKEEGILYEN